ncbi:MAG TPA: galactose oxidase-like domain-containing protein, partial [Mycobacteriales bacterium]|nr:galactose oxidase-like domain-containing protein [Mycobacteriales bacterium]
LTHLVDGDQRVVDLAVTGRTGDTLTVAVPGPNVVPPGPYLLFIMTKPGQLQVPSVARQVFVGVPAPAYLAGSPGDQGSGTDLGSSHGRGGARGHRGHHGAPTAASVRGSAPAAVVLGAAASSPRVRARAAASVQPVWGWLPVLPLVLAISWLGFGRLRRRRHRVAAR